MIAVRLPARTTTGLPLTGARRYRTPWASAASATRADAGGEIVLISISSAPDGAAASRPSGAASTASAAASFARNVMAVSASRQTAP